MSRDPGGARAPSRLQTPTGTRAERGPHQSTRTPADKVLSLGDLLSRYGRPRTETVVFTNGCFEILHAGHVTYLAEARSLGDMLVVGVNSDASARRLGKGEGRPAVSEEDRALVVAALESVDVVCVFEEDTPAELVSALLPDIIVKGADYAMDEVAGRDIVERAGGRVELIPMLEGRSTTELIGRIRAGAGQAAGDLPA